MKKEDLNTNTFVGEASIIITFGLTSKFSFTFSISILFEFEIIIPNTRKTILNNWGSYNLFNHENFHYLKRATEGYEIRHVGCSQYEPAFPSTEDTLFVM